VSGSRAGTAKACIQQLTVTAYVEYLRAFKSKAASSDQNQQELVKSLVGLQAPPQQLTVTAYVEQVRGVGVQAPAWHVHNSLQ
jgi:hypothetical protein